MGLEEKGVEVGYVEARFALLEFGFLRLLSILTERTPIHKRAPLEMLGRQYLMEAERIDAALATGGLEVSDE